MFGADGDALHRAGCGAIYFGPLTHAATERFGIKLAKALFYLYNNRLFDGDVYLRNITVIGRDRDIERRYLAKVLPFAPIPALPERNRKSLADQFACHYNHNAEIVHAIIEFNPQLIYHLLAVSQKVAEEMRASAPLREANMHHCVLKSSAQR